MKSETLDLLLEPGAGLGKSFVFGDPEGQVFAVGIMLDTVFFQRFRLRFGEQPTDAGDADGVCLVGFGLDHGAG